MKKFLIFTVTIITFVLVAVGCSKQTNGDKEPHFAIYLAELPKNFEQNEEMLKEVKILGDPILTDKDIKEYKFNEHKIILTEGFELAGYIGMNGSTFVVVAEGEKIYAGVFRSVMDSYRFPTGVPSIYDAKSYAKEKGFIQISYTGSKTDMRKDKRIKAALKKAGVLK